MKSFLKRFLMFLGIKPSVILGKMGEWSIKMAGIQSGRAKMMNDLRKIQPDLSEQYSVGKDLYSDYVEIKLRTMHAFQCSLMLRMLNELQGSNIVVVDIGDSAGTHMQYLKELSYGHKDVETISINLDSRAVEKIKAKGLKAILCRAEDLNIEGHQVDFFTSFEMVEHLHNPSIFFYRLAKKSACNKIVLTVPYLRRSRVGLHNVRSQSKEKIFAEDEHIFELSPTDWTLLMLQAGWRVRHSEVYCQYPKKWPLISFLLSCYWRKVDYEGFWGAILEKDTAFSECYLDWED